MQRVGDGSPENAEGLTVERVQSTGGHVYRNFTGQKQILVKNELQFLIGLTASLDHAGTCVQLQTAAGLQVQFGFYSTAATLDLGNFFICQRS